MYKTLIWPWENENWRKVSEATLVGDMGICVMHLIQAFWSGQTQLHCFLMIDHPRPFWLYAWRAWQNLVHDEQFQRHGLACVYVSSIAQWCLTLLQPHGHCSLPGSSVRGDSPGKNTGHGCYALLQGIFQTPGLNPHLCVFCIKIWILYPTWEALVTWYSVEILLHLPGLSHLQQAASQKEYNSPLVLAQPWLARHGTVSRISLWGLS